MPTSYSTTTGTKNVYQHDMIFSSVVTTTTSDRATPTAGTSIGITAPSITSTTNSISLTSTPSLYSLTSIENKLQEAEEYLKH